MTNIIAFKVQIYPKTLEVKYLGTMGSSNLKINSLCLSAYKQPSKAAYNFYIKLSPFGFWFVFCFCFFFSRKGSNNRKNQVPYRNSLVLPRAGEADKLRDLARPRLVLLHSSSS